MANYRKNAHSVYDLKYHLVWITKYRKPVLVKEIQVRMKEILKQICAENDIHIVKGNVGKDHIHMLISVPPSLSISDVAKKLKGKSSWKILHEFKTLEKIFWGRHFWGRGYFCASTGAVDESLIKQYIENQDIADDDDFKLGKT